VTNRDVWDRWPAGRHQIVQVALLAVILSFLVTTVPGVRAYQGYSWWMDGILQNLAYGAAAVLCLVRTPSASPERTGWRFLALGLLSFGLSNVLYVWFPVETSDIAAALSGYGCDIAQGHYFSHPVTAPELLNLISQPTHTTDRHLSKCVGGLRLSTRCGANGSQQH
jgi:hypothetical protein